MIWTRVDRSRVDSLRICESIVDYSTLMNNRYWNMIPIGMVKIDMGRNIYGE